MLTTYDFITGNLSCPFYYFDHLGQVGPSTLLAAGHDCVPVMFAVDGANRISQGVKLEETK